MKNETQTTEWLKSREVMKTLKIRACDLMHLREAGKLKFTKQGNAFLYSSQSVLKQKKELL
jgi:hypothetical protein